MTATLTNQASHSATLANQASHSASLSNTGLNYSVFLKKEDGGFLLLENGYAITLEQSPVSGGFMNNQALS